MASAKDFRELSKSRLRVAKLLMKNKDYNGVVDNVGYSLELALKAVICKHLCIGSYPDAVTAAPKTKQYQTEVKIVNFFKTHDFSILLMLTGLSKFFNLATSISPNLVQNWGYITMTWSTEVRYEPIGTYSKAIAQAMIDAAESSPDGVITFIKNKKRW